MMTTTDPEGNLLDASKKMRDEAVHFRAKFDVFIEMLNRAIEETDNDSYRDTGNEMS